MAFCERGGIKTYHSSHRLHTLTNAPGLCSYYLSKIDELEKTINEKSLNLRCLEAQRNELNSRGTNDYGHTIASHIVCVQCAFCARSCSCFRSLAPTSVRSP